MKKEISAKSSPSKVGTTAKVQTPEKKSPGRTTRETRGTRSTTKPSEFVSLAPNGKDTVTGTGSVVRDLADKYKSTPKYERLSHHGREGVTEEQPEAQQERKKLKAKVAVAKNRVETEEEFLETEIFESQQI